MDLFAGQVITCCTDVGCNNKATVISNFDIICICTTSFLFCPNGHSGLSYSLNTGSLKAENSLNWLVYLFPVNAFSNSFILYYYKKKEKKCDLFFLPVKEKSQRIYKLSTARRRTQVCCFPKGLVDMNQEEKQEKREHTNNKTFVWLVVCFNIVR